MTNQRNREYWVTRFKALEEAGYQQGEECYKDIQEQIERAIYGMQMDIERWYQRLADNNGISYAAAKKLLSKGELREFKWTVEQYIKAGEENAINQRWMKELENASARYHISYLEAMKIQIRQYQELLSAKLEESTERLLQKNYESQYYHTAYEVARGTGIGTNLTRLDARKVELIIRLPWASDGASFSDRIWTDKEKLVNTLHTELSQNIIRGSSSQKTIDNLKKVMGVNRSHAGRLIMTETAAISAVAQKDCLKTLGVEEFEVIETLDDLTCDLCQDMDGQHYPMTDYRIGETVPPFHPRCRGFTIPYFDDNFSTTERRAARDQKTGKTVNVGSLTYKEWKKQYIS